MREIVDVASVFPLRHTIIVITACVLVTHTVRVANEERTTLVFNTKVDHFASGLLRERMPRPVTISALLVLVVTAARWISPRSTVACTAPGACSACGTSR